MRQLVWPYIFKTYSIGDLAEFLEIYGLPIRVGTYPAQATKEEKATLLKPVAALGHDAAGIIPEGMVVDFKEPADGKQEPFMAMIELMERTESKVILGATLTSQADGKSSTNALGVVHNEVRLDILASDARQIASSLTRDLVYPIGVLNGLITDPRRRPRFVFDVQEEEDFKTMAEALKVVIVDMGVKVPASWAYEQLRIPVPAEGEDIIEPPAPALPPVAPPAQARGNAPRSFAALAAMLRSKETPFPTRPSSTARSRRSIPPSCSARLRRCWARSSSSSATAARSTRSRPSSLRNTRRWIRHGSSSCSSARISCPISGGG
jgi:phage gp29-like protein